MAKDDIERGVSMRLENAMMAAKPDGLTERQWCIKGKVSTSFFTDLRNGREPGIDKVERMANAIGLSLSDLIEGIEAPAAQPVPSVEQLASMVQIAVDQGVSLGTRPADLPDIVAPVLRAQLGLYQSGVLSLDPEDGTIVPDRAVQSRPPTKRSETEAPRRP